MCRSPSWGAWIEICRATRTRRTSWRVAPPRGERGLKYYFAPHSSTTIPVAPPRGERGLKCRPARSCPQAIRRSPSWGAWIEIACLARLNVAVIGRSPSWGAWIEMVTCWSKPAGYTVAPPRGERGLKFGVIGACKLNLFKSLPLVGSVD